MNERGTALIATLAVVMILLPLGAYVVLQCRTDLMIERNFNAEVETFYAAEAGLEHALAEIRPGQSFDDVLAGPDRIRGTADDGAFPFDEGTPAAFPSQPFVYDVRVAAGGDGLVSVVSRATGRAGASKTVAALVKRSPLVFTPAALYAGVGVAHADFGEGHTLLSGLDHQSSDPPTLATGAAPAGAALASPDQEAEMDLRAKLPDFVTRELLGAGGTPSIATVPTFDVESISRRSAAQSAAVAFGELHVPSAVVLGTPRTPQISIVHGSVDVSGSLTGNGMLIIEGGLHVSGRLEFTGIIVGMNDLTFESASNVMVSGALWQGGNERNRLELRGEGAIMYSSRALTAVDNLFPALLPHAAVVAGWQEQL